VGPVWLELHSFFRLHRLQIAHEAALGNHRDEALVTGLEHHESRDDYYFEICFGDEKHASAKEFERLFSAALFNQVHEAHVVSGGIVLPRNPRESLQLYVTLTRHQAKEKQIEVETGGQHYAHRLKNEWQREERNVQRAQEHVDGKLDWIVAVRLVEE